MSNTDDTHPFFDIDPPKPRKQPQQSRSRMLVESVKEACILILKEEGPSALTATQISEKSGVAMGSIYQYFPSVDAIVATIYEDLIEDQFESARKFREIKRKMTFEEAFSLLIHETIAFHRRMLELDKDFHQRFCRTFDLQRWYNETANDPEATTKFIRKILVRYKAEHNSTNIEISAFIITTCLRSTVLAAVKYHPEYILSSVEFEQDLMKTCFSIVNIANKTPTVDKI